jgi:phosphohistidine phosphatase
MKTLFLLRHAKSSWSNPTLEDKFRPLNKRGMRDAPLMGSRLMARDEALDHIITSPATRARRTAELFAETCDFQLDNIVEESDLYFTSTRSIEDLIIGQGEQIQSLMLVFHNPDITGFANSIDTANRIANVPSCGLIKLICDIESWRDWSVSNTRFDYFDYPKKVSD